MVHLSIPTLVRNAIGADKDWPQKREKLEPKSNNDAIIVSAGGYGLGTTYYLARGHGIANVAVLDKGWLSGGRQHRSNAMIIRSNCLYDENARLCDHALGIWEGLSLDINYNVMFSRPGENLMRTPDHWIKR